MPAHMVTTKNSHDACGQYFQVLPCQAGSAEGSGGPGCWTLTASPFALLSSPPCGPGACFGQTRISVGKANQRLTYADQVLQLTYEDGSPCPSKTGQTYKSVISFVCRPEAGPTNRPMLVSLDKQTCTLFFSWHTPLACEQAVSLPWSLLPVASLAGVCPDAALTYQCRWEGGALDGCWGVCVALETIQT